MGQIQADVTRVRLYLDEQRLTEQERLPPERELAEALGMTRTRLRRVLRDLAAEGVIWRHVGKGTYLGPKLLPNGADGISDSLSVLTNPREVMEARLSFEPALASLAALRGTGHQFAELARCLDEMRIEKNWTGFRQLDVKFHRLIAQASGNALLLMLFNIIRASQTKEVWGQLQPHLIRSIDLPIEEHATILDALRGRNAARAADAMRTHLQAVSDSIFKS
jgi:GntR family transcriptional repressor for pyruvate dehydrogenase complex